MAEPPQKQRKVDPCIICGKNSAGDVLVGLHDMRNAQKDSSKKHIRRHLENEFGKTINFFNVGRIIYLRPHTLSPDAMACELIDLQRKLEAYKNEEHCSLN